MLLSLTALMSTGVAQADPVNNARDSFYKSLRAHSTGKAELADVENAYGRLQKAKRERDAAEKSEQEPPPQEMGNDAKPKPEFRMEYGRSLTTFPPEISLADQVGSVEVAPIEYRDGSEPTTVRKMPGLKKYGNVTLKWGITDSVELSNWNLPESREPN